MARNWLWFVQRLALLAFTSFALAGSCDTADPPGDGFLFLSVEKTAVRPGYDALNFNVTQVAVFYDDVVLPTDDPRECKACKRECKRKALSSLLDRDGGHDRDDEREHHWGRDREQSHDRKYDDEHHRDRGHEQGHDDKYEDELEEKCSIECCLNPCDTEGAVVIPLATNVPLDLKETGRVNMASVPTRPGVIQEVRIFISDLSAIVDGETITEDSHDNPFKSIEALSGCKLPPERGHGHKRKWQGVLRLVPADGQEISIRTDEQTTVVSPFDPNVDIETLVDKELEKCKPDHDCRWPGHRWLSTPGASSHRHRDKCDPICQMFRFLRLGLNGKYPMSLVPDADGVFDDRIVVAFDPGVTRARINEIITANGYSVIAVDHVTSYYLLKLPSGVSVQDAIKFFDGVSEVRFDLPDTIVHDRQVIPCDPGFQNPGPFTQVNADDAWAVTQGSTVPLLADIDSGFDMTNADMVPNYFINAGELPAALTGDTTPVDGFADADFDQDGFITFVDLNNPGLTPAQAAILTGAGLAPPLNPNTLIAALADGVDDDDFDADTTTFIDDLVGWDFIDGDNMPQGGGTNNCTVAHGVGTSGIIAAIGSPPPAPGGMCGSGLVAGMNWRARLVPIRNGGAGLAASTRATSYLALRYAVQLGADAINASWGVTYARGTACNRAINNIGDKFGELTTRLQQEATTLNLGNTVLVGAVENCAINDDDANIFDWPPELAHPNIIGVTSVNPAGAAAVLAANRAFGPGVIDISANGEGHTMLGYGATVPNCSGTSFAAPQVTGTIGLMIANGTAPQGNAATVINRVLCNAQVVAGLNAQVGGGGRVLDVNQAVTNANACP